MGATMGETRVHCLFRLHHEHFAPVAFTGHPHPAGANQVRSLCGSSSAAQLHVWISGRLTQCSFENPAHSCDFRGM
jgi:hypothetical protein